MKFYRFLALLLTLAMLFSLSAYAAHTGSLEETIEDPSENLTEEPTEETAEEPLEEPTEETTEESAEDTEDDLPVPLPDELQGLVEEAIDDGETYLAGETINFTNAAPVINTQQSPPFRADSAVASNDALETTKYAIDNGDGTYTITMEAYATGDVTTTTTAIPTDIVLVIDQSTSLLRCMKCDLTTGIFTDYHITSANGPRSDAAFYYYNGSDGNRYYAYYCSSCNAFYTRQHTTYSHAGSKLNNPYVAVACDCEDTKFPALTAAISAFCADIETKAAGTDGRCGTSDDINYRIAFVGFANGGTNYTTAGAYYNTELFVGGTQYQMSSSSGLCGISETAYKNAFQDANTNAGIANINASIAALEASGLTHTHDGIKLGNNVFAQNPIADGELRNRVMVVFTDGIPGYDELTNAQHTIYADYAISNAYTTKQTHGATVYSVGIFLGANATVPPSLTNSQDWSTNTKVADTFLHLVSSNYPTATSYTSRGSVNPNLSDDGYYLSAGDADALLNAFHSISENIATPAISLDETAILRDVITPYFQLESGNIADIEVYTSDYNGRSFSQTLVDVSDSVTVTIGADGRTIDVVGFDYSENFVSQRQKPDRTYGKKLVVKITIKPIDGYHGGAFTPTNVSGSGIYASDGTVVEHFVIPAVDVLLTCDADTLDQTIYLGENADFEAILSYCTPDGINNAYSNITHTLTWPDGTVICTYTILAGQTTGTFVWADGYSAEYPLEETTTFTLNVTIESLYDSANANYDDSVKIALDPKVTVIPLSLTITKEVTGDAEVDDVFFFRVEGPNSLSLTVSIQGEGSVTIEQLPIGDYTVTELTDWSWRYECKSDVTQEVTLSQSQLTYTFEYENELVKTSWLTATNLIRNIFYSLPAGKGEEE